MALVLADRVKETTTSIGTGAVTLAGAVSGFQSFAVVGNANTTYYTIVLGSQWEVGIGTYTASGTTLSRDTVLESSNANALVPFAAGIKDVFVTYPADKAISDGYGTLPVANGGTNSTSTATAGGVAYGTGAAIVVNAAGPAGYVLTSGGAAPPVWTPVASLAVGTSAYWGSFWDTTTQTAPAPNTAYMLTLNSADPTNNGVTVVSGSRVTFTHAGVYSLTFSIQFENTDNANAAHDVNVWLRKNDSGSTGDVPDSDSKFTVPPKHAGVKGSLIGTVNFVLTLAAGDFIELVYAVTDVTVTVASTPAGTSPVSPRIPSIIFTAVAAAPVGLGYAGVESFTSLTVGTGSKTFTVNTNATDTAFIVGNRVRLVNSSVNYMDGVITAYSGTSMTVLVDGTAGSGTYTAWFVTLTGSVGGVTSFSGNSTGLTPATPTVGAISLAGTLNVANGGTGATTLTANNVLLGNGTSAVQVVAPGTTGNVLTSNGTTWASTAAPSSVVQYPQNSQSVDYTLVLGDAGKQIFHPASDMANRIFTIPANSSVAFPIGTVVLFTVENDGATVTVAITSDTLVFGSGVTGSIAVPVNNTLMCIKVTATKWMANYLFQDNNLASQVLAVAHNNTPFVSAYPLNGGTFGTKFTNPATLPASTGNGVAFTSAGNAIAVAHANTPFVSVYSWNGAGFGVKFADPATLPASTGNGVAFTSAGDAIAVAHNTTPFVSVYPWSGSGFGVKFADPATLPASTGTSVAFSPSGSAIAVAHNTTPYVSVYPWSGSGFGTKFTNPATLPTGNGLGVAFSSTGNSIAVAHATTPFVSAYPFSGSGFGTKYANPATLPASTGNGVAFNSVGGAVNAIAVAHATTPFVSAYPFSGSGFGVKLADPATLPASTGNEVSFNPAGDTIAVAHNTTPFVSVYLWNVTSGFGTKFTNPATLPASTGNSVAFTISA